MRLLTATVTTQGDVEGDYDSGVVPGEIVEPDSMCDRDGYIRWPGGCGCGRTFVGMASGKRTTTAVITDVDITVEQLRSLVAEHHQDAEPEDVDGMVDDLVGYGQELDLGAVVGIWRYQVEMRQL